jgi:TonB family protein
LLHPMWTRLSAEVSRALGLQRPVRLLRSHRATMPVTWGVLQPRVLLPKEAEDWPLERVRVVLSHELAHVQRRDWLFQMLAEAGRVLYWFNPLAWVNCDRLRRESEQACDDAVLNSGIDAPDYAEHLLELARTLKSSDRAWSVALAMARQTNLERRFMAMLDPSVKRRAVTRKATFLTVFAAVCLTVTLASLRAPAQALSGRFSGVVYDDTGGVIQNATVIVSNPEAKTKDMTTTSQFGSFEFVSLPSGQYVLEVLKPGFARYVLTGLGLQPGESLHKNVTLRLGTVSERIDVVAAAPAKQTPVAQAGEGERVRVGGHVQQTKLAKMVRPAYPPVARSTGIEGTVLLEAIIGTDGSLMSLRVMNSQIDPDLAKAAVEAVSQWRYEPTLLNGVPVEVITKIIVSFQLSQ